MVSTDYPDLPLLAAIELNAKTNIPAALLPNFLTLGFIWGDELPVEMTGKFDVILLADIIFNHNQHTAILKSCRQMLAEGGVVVTTFSHHVVKWKHRDLVFLEEAREGGWRVEAVYEETHDPMFPEDDGDLTVRSTVYCYKMYLD